MDLFGEKKSQGMSRKVRGRDIGVVFSGGETWHSATIFMLKLGAMEI